MMPVTHNPVFTPAFILKNAFLYKVEQALKDMPQAECPVEHEFSDGVYLRKMSAPANCMVVGARHRLRTMNILLEGEVSYYGGESIPCMRVKAPATFTSDAMTRKLLFFHEPSVFATVHPTKETDPDEIVKQFTIPEDEFVNLLKKEIGLCPGL